MSSFPDIWNGLREAGYLKPEYDQPIEAFGTTVERVLDPIVEASIEPWIEDSQLVEDLRGQVSDREDELKEALDLDGSEMNWDALVERTKSEREQDQEARKKLIELLGLDDSGLGFEWPVLTKAVEDKLGDPAVPATVVMEGPTPAEWDELRRRAEQAEAAGQSLAHESEKLARDLETAQGALRLNGERLVQQETLVRKGCDELQAALGLDAPKLGLRGWHELIEEVRVRTQVYQPGAPLAPAFEMGRQAPVSTGFTQATQTQPPARRRRSQATPEAGEGAAGKPGERLVAPSGQAAPRPRRSQAGGPSAE